MNDMNRSLLTRIGVDPETIKQIEQILEMTNHPFNDMLQHFIEEGTMEVVRNYSRNKKYRHIFPKFFPEFTDQNLDVPASEDSALTLFHDMRREFGWGGTVFTRADAEGMARRDLTDEEWSRVVASNYWKKGLPDRLAERGWSEVENALREAEITPATCKQCKGTLDDSRYCESSDCTYSVLQQDEDPKEA